MEQRLRRTVLRRLESLGEQAASAEPGVLVTLARTEIRRLTDGWRGLLADHQPDDDGRCQRCAGWIRNRRWPCQVWLAAHQHLIGEATWHKPRRKVRPNVFARRGPTVVAPRRRAAVGAPIAAITAVPSLPDALLVRALPTAPRPLALPPATRGGVHRAPVADHGNDHWDVEHGAPQRVRASR